MFDRPSDFQRCPNVEFSTLSSRRIFNVVQPSNFQRCPAVEFSTLSSLRIFNSCPTVVISTAVLLDRRISWSSTVQDIDMKESSKTSVPTDVSEIRGPHHQQPPPRRSSDLAPRSKRPSLSFGISAILGSGPADEDKQTSAPSKKTRLPGSSPSPPFKSPIFPLDFVELIGLSAGLYSGAYNGTAAAAAAAAAAFNNYGINSSSPTASQSAAAVAAAAAAGFLQSAFYSPSILPGLVKSLSSSQRSTNVCHASGLQQAGQGTPSHNLSRSEHLPSNLSRPTREHLPSNLSRWEHLPSNLSWLAREPPPSNLSRQARKRTSNRAPFFPGCRKEKIDYPVIII